MGACGWVASKGHAWLCHTLSFSRVLFGARIPSIVSLVHTGRTGLDWRCNGWVGGFDRA